LKLAPHYSKAVACRFRRIILENAANHGEYGEKQEITMVYPITRWVSLKKNPKLKLFAVPTVLPNWLWGISTVVKPRFHSGAICGEIKAVTA
jgi:hypothetical protein